MCAHKNSGYSAPVCLRSCVHVPVVLRRFILWRRSPPPFFDSRACVRILQTHGDERRCGHPKYGPAFSVLACPVCFSRVGITCESAQTAHNTVKQARVLPYPSYYTKLLLDFIFMYCIFKMLFKMIYGNEIK